jgi:hypothetical protein
VCEAQVNGVYEDSCSREALRVSALALPYVAAVKLKETSK